MPPALCPECLLNALLWTWLCSKPPSYAAATRPACPRHTAIIRGTTLQLPLFQHTHSVTRTHTHITLEIHRARARRCRPGQAAPPHTASRVHVRGCCRSARARHLSTAQTRKARCLPGERRHLGQTAARPTVGVAAHNQSQHQAAETHHTQRKGSARPPGAVQQPACYLL